MDYRAQNVNRAFPDLIGSPKQIEWARSIRRNLLIRIERDDTSSLDDRRTLRDLIYDIIDARWFIAVRKHEWTVAQMLGVKRPASSQLTIERAVQECVEAHSKHYTGDENKQYWDEVRSIIEEQCREELENGGVR
jgi:hypothetical protein